MNSRFLTAITIAAMLAVAAGIVADMGLPGTCFGLVACAIVAGVIGTLLWD